MNRMIKYAAAASVAGVFALGMAQPSQAAHGRNAAAAVGFGAGVVTGAAVANANNGYYGPRYGYAYAPESDYDYGYKAYAYAPREYRSKPACAFKGNYGVGLDYSLC